ncbi:MAG: rod shape-determining protein MreC [Verrucomicrobiales bacterium]|jgi:rod shape-determining protein MreC
MAAPQQSGRRRITLGLIFLASATLITLDFQSFGPLGTIQTGAREVVAPIRAGGERIASPITGLWDGATNFDDLERENIELRAEVDRLRGELVRSGVDRSDYEALLAINGLEVPAGYPLLLAKVRTGEVGNFTSGVVEIDVGTADGVAKDMAVVTAAGVVGRVERADRSSSTVRLVSSTEFVMGVEVAGEVGLARGTGSATEIEIAQGIGIRAQVSVGDPVTTTSSERTLFPSNLVIGTVSGLERNEDASNENVTVELAANPVDLRFVSVVLIEPGAEIEDAPEGIAR